MKKDSLNNQQVNSEHTGADKGFQYYWDLEGDFIEEINRSGSDGWSGVIVTSERDNGGFERKICIKKQENYFSYSSVNFIRGRLTVENEARNLIFCHRNGLTVPEVIFYGKRDESGDRQGILVTQFLDNFTSLDDILYKGEHKLRCNTELRRVLIDKVAREVRKLHRLRIVHNNLYPKHIFIDTNTLEVAFIDFEKGKKKFTAGKCVFRDLEVLNRYTPMISRADKLRFLKIYFGVTVFNSKLRKLWVQIAKVAIRKQERKNRKR
jgi:tRNA A-37 threonylcarbamoyl transferase component Bud32